MVANKEVAEEGEREKLDASLEAAEERRLAILAAISEKGKEEVDHVRTLTSVGSKFPAVEAKTVCLLTTFILLLTGQSRSRQTSP